MYTGFYSENGGVDIPKYTKSYIPSATMYYYNDIADSKEETVQNFSISTLK